MMAESILREGIFGVILVLAATYTDRRTNARMMIGWAVDRVVWVEAGCEEGVRFCAFLLVTTRMNFAQLR